MDTITKFIATHIHQITFDKLDFIDRSSSCTEFEQYFTDRIIARIKEGRRLGKDPFDEDLSLDVASVNGLIHDFDQGIAGEIFGSENVSVLSNSEFTNALTVLGFPERNIANYVIGAERVRLRELSEQKVVEKLIIIT